MTRAPPFRAGSQWRAERRWSVWLGACRFQRERVRCRSRAAVARSPRSFPRETGRLALGRQGAVLLLPFRSMVPVQRPPGGQPRSGTGGHNGSEATVTPGGSSCPCTSNSSGVWQTQDPRWPWEQVQSEL